MKNETSANDSRNEAASSTSAACGADELDDDAADDQTDGLVGEAQRAREPRADGDQLRGLEDVRHGGGARRLEQRGEQLGDEQQDEEHPQRQADAGGERQHGDDHRPREVGDEHERAAREPVGERAEQSGAEEGRDERDGEGRGGEQRGAGLGEDEQGERDAGDLVAGLARSPGRGPGPGTRGRRATSFTPTRGCTRERRARRVRRHA